MLTCIFYVFYFNYCYNLLQHRVSAGQKKANVCSVLMVMTLTKIEVFLIENVKYLRAFG